MPVPDSAIISLQNVIDEVNPLTDDLLACITASLDRKYDINYGGPNAGDLYQFRNYGNFQTIQLSATGASTAAGGCALTANTNYATDLSVLVIVGTIIYTNYASNTVLNGGNNWYKYLNFSIQISATGEVLNISNCYSTIQLSSSSGTSSGACGLTAGTDYYIDINDTVAVNNYIYTDTALTTPLNGGGNFFKYGSNQVISVDSVGKILTVGGCSASISISVTGYADGITACAASGSMQTKYYPIGDGIVIGTVIYNDSALTSPFNGGQNHYDQGFNALQIDTNGEIMAVRVCK